MRLEEKGGREKRVSVWKKIDQKIYIYKKKNVFKILLFIS